MPWLTDEWTDKQTKGQTDGRRTKSGDNTSAELKLKAELKMKGVFVSFYKEYVLGDECIQAAKL